MRLFVLFFACFVAVATPALRAQNAPPALGIALEGYDYPYPVQYLPLVNDGKAVQMAYMDVPAAGSPNGKTIVLLHGKNFGGYYFRDVIDRLSHAGYRVIVPDQVGWGKSSKPDVHYSFQMLAANTAALLDHLGVGKIDLLGHSMAGMLAVRFTLMYPQRVARLVLEDPLGMEDYRLKIPPQSDDTLYQHELQTTDPAKIRASYAGLFAHPDPAIYGPLADVQIRVAQSPYYPQWALASALAWQMVYQQPVRYEYHLLQPPTLFIVGAQDHLVPLGNYAKPADFASLGHMVELARAAARDVPHARVAVVSNAGHIPHLEEPQQFYGALLPFLQQP